MEWWQALIVAGPATITSVAALISAINTRKALSLQEQREADRLLDDRIESGINKFMAQKRSP